MRWENLSTKDLAQVLRTETPQKGRRISEVLVSRLAGMLDDLAA